MLRNVRFYNLQRWCWILQGWTTGSLCVTPPSCVRHGGNLHSGATKDGDCQKNTFYASGIGFERMLGIFATPKSVAGVVPSIWWCLALSEGDLTYAKCWWFQSRKPALQQEAPALLVAPPPSPGKPPAAMLWQGFQLIGWWAGRRIAGVALDLTNHV